MVPDELKRLFFDEGIKVFEGVEYALAYMRWRGGDE
jgi:hypothetical protein